MSALTILADLVHRRSGLVLGPDKLYLMEARLGGLMRREAIPDLASLAHRLQTERNEALEQDVVEAMATHETLFFRDQKPFEHLRNTGLPTLLRNRGPGARLRMWSAAASTGQEAYSIAMMIAESGLIERHRVEIVGTDLARGPIARARAGLYTQYEVQRGLSVHNLLEHFTRQGEEWQINRPIRSMCSFREWNLLDDIAPLGKFDVVFCRNVLFYFDVPTKAKVLAAIRRQMAPDGLLYLGSAETTMGLDDALERDGPSHALHANAPRAATGHKHSTLPPRTPTYQS
ncbi:protein-glutamate O-methyltransferase CheR [Acidisphaera sp. L21]|uniref:CheR family methyltransferase n=1 Tax=Acidisphaera sp. L21 TaxID=1641851 RepID=UPI00131BF1EF|nr:protein-glutamate O-methyltransferase CheR [Acidisphaera sp. L21]